MNKDLNSDEVKDAGYSKYGVYSAGLHIVTGIVGKSTAAQQLLTTGKVAYAFDGDYLMNSLSKSVGFRLWDKISVNEALLLCAKIIAKIGYIAKLNGFSVAIACTPALARAVLDSGIEIHEFIFTTELTESFTLKLWNERFEKSGNWKTMADKSHQKPTYDGYVEILSSIRRTIAKDSLKFYQMHSLDMPAAAVNPNLTYDILASSWKHFRLHAEATGDFSLKETSIEKTVVIGDKPDTASLFNYAHGDVMFITHPRRMDLTLLNPSQFDGLVAGVDKISVDEMRTLIKESKIDLALEEALFIHGIDGTGIPLRDLLEYEKRDGFVNRTGELNKAVMEKRGTKLLFKNDRWCIFRYSNKASLLSWFKIVLARK